MLSVNNHNVRARFRRFAEQQRDEHSRLQRCVLLAADRMPFLPAALQRTLSLFARKGDEVFGRAACRRGRAGCRDGEEPARHRQFGSLRPLQCGWSVRQGISRIGIHKTRNTLLGLSIFRSFRGVKLPKNWSSARFSSHSLAAAIFSDLIVQEVQTDDAEWAFLAGLLHDIGLLLIATALPDQSLSVSDTLSDFQLAERDADLPGGAGTVREAYRRHPYSVRPTRLSVILP